MFFGMLFIHLFLMPILMVNQWNHLELLSLSQIYVGIWMSSLMVILETFIHPLSLSGLFIMISLVILSFFAFRNQWFVTDKDYIKEMIPHHSMAILTSQSRIQNPNSSIKIKSLAENIIQTQEKEIQIMKSFL
jgi:hypothetical protein